MITVTFDTCVWRRVVDERKAAAHEQAQSLIQIRDLVLNGKIKPFLSDTSVVLEGIPRKERANAFANMRPTTKFAKSVLADGTEIDHVMISPRTNHLPELPPELCSDIETARKMGFEFINTPRVANRRVQDSWYKQESPEQLSNRLGRDAHAYDVLRNHGFGAEQVQELSREMIAKDPSLVWQGLMRAFASAESAKVTRVVSEWADGDAVVAHYAHGHDYFCTVDAGKGAGQQSILHLSHREWLEQQLEIQIVTPYELVKVCQTNI